MSDLRAIALAGSVLCSCLALPLAAQDAEGPGWRAQKCALYRAAVEAALEFQGREGLTEAFLAANQSFIDGGCQDRGAVCPVTAAELTLADILTIMTMNEGMASTFVPFNCP
jgi:hypothetical protein